MQNMEWASQQVTEREIFTKENLGKQTGALLVRFRVGTVAGSRLGKKGKELRNRYQKVMKQEADMEIYDAQERS